MKNTSYTIDINDKSTAEFRNDVITGLTNSPKHLDPKYFYNKTGDRLFQQIMDMPEYYLTDCELDIFRNQTAELADVMLEDREPFDLIELGAGDAKKTTHLLQYLFDNGSDFTYIPIDISSNILNELENNLGKTIPGLRITSLQGDYFSMLGNIPSNNRRKIVLFLGSNIGNMEYENALLFCQRLNQNLVKGDTTLIGFDLQKDPYTILRAYNDEAGITASFNVNLLRRINEELKGNFDISQFEHYASYDPISGACRSFLISRREQIVRIDDRSITFEKHEFIHMEISQKFTINDISMLASNAGFELVETLKDRRDWFASAIWRMK